MQILSCQHHLDTIWNERPAFLTGSRCHFCGLRLAEKGKTWWACPASCNLRLQVGNRRAGRDHILLLRKGPPSDHSKHSVGKTVPGLSSSSTTGLGEVIPRSRRTVCSRSVQMGCGFRWVGCCAREPRGSFRLAGFVREHTIILNVHLEGREPKGILSAAPLLQPPLRKTTCRGILAFFPVVYLISPWCSF